MTARENAAQTINSQCPTRHHVHSPYSLTLGLRNLGSTTGEQGVHQRITDDSTMARMAVDRMLKWFCRKEPASAGFLLLEINEHPWDAKLAREGLDAVCLPYRGQRLRGQASLPQDRLA
jgi:DNA-binding transcriptional LysR family regulator